jgi:hypothetical protein
MPFCVVLIHSALAKSAAVGWDMVWGDGKGPKSPWMGVMLTGLRRMLAELWDVGWVRGMGELMAMWDVFIAEARCVQRGWRVEDEGA